MKISSIYSYNPFNLIQAPFVQTRNNYGISFGANLSPLQKDTVSFSGSAKLCGKHMDMAPDMKMCNSIHDSAVPVAAYLKEVLNKYITPINKNYPEDKPAVTMKTGIKSPQSIREKVVSKFNKIAAEEKKDFCDAAVSEILEFYDLPDNINEETAKFQVNLILDLVDEVRYKPPYGNEKMFLQEIMRILEENQLIKFNSNCGISQSQVQKEIVKKLKTLTKSKHCEQKGLYINPEEEYGIKYYANDIVRGRIILNKSDKSIVKEVIQKLKEAAQAGAINITSVENYIPSHKKLRAGHRINDYQYHFPKVFEKLANESNAEYIESESKSGYMAIHVNLDFSGEKYNNNNTQNNKYNGYQAEVQIMDANVEDLKEIEDLCYKIKDDKTVVNRKYKDFVDHFNTYYKLQKVKDAFNAYTYALYLHQREKSLQGKHKESAFPSIKSMGYEGLVPSELDFNLLKKIKERCEKNN